VDTIAFGPIPLRSIEWMLFPHIAEYDRGSPTFPKRRVSQDIDAIKRIISDLGKYPMEVTDRGLLVNGYLPAGR